MRGTQQSLLATAALVAVVGACSRSAPGDPDRGAFRPHALYGLEPIPNIGGSGGYGPHDATGFRGASMAKDAPIRILVLGGGAVYGVGLESSQTIAARLARALEAMGARASVVNGGCPSHCLAASLLRTHFLLRDAHPTHVLYIGGKEDVDVYGAADFVSDLGHVPRPWTGKALAAGGELRDAGNAAFRRDLISLDVETRMLGGGLFLAVPADSALASLRPALSKVAGERQRPFVELPTDRDVATQTLARALLGR